MAVASDELGPARKGGGAKRIRYSKYHRDDIETWLRARQQEEEAEETAA